MYSIAVGALAVLRRRWCSILLRWWVASILRRWRAVLGLSVAVLLGRGPAVASAVHRFLGEVLSNAQAPGARLAARRFGGEAVLAYRLPSLFARGQLSRYGFRAAVVDYERYLSSLRAARAAVRQKARSRRRASVERY